jgi:hypothetical protein
MRLSRAVRTATHLVGLAALAAASFVAPAMPAPASARAASDCQAGGQAPPKSLAFVVRYVERRPAGEFILTFENGEVWQQDDPTNQKKMNIERGEQVVIRRSASGVFTLVARDGQSTRVKRMH